MILFIFLLILLCIGGVFISPKQRMLYLAVSMASLMVLFWWISFLSSRSGWCQVSTVDTTRSCDALVAVLSLLNAHEIRHFLVDASLRNQLSPQQKHTLLASHQLAIAESDKHTVISLLKEAKLSQNLDVSFDVNEKTTIAEIYASTSHARRANLKVICIV